MEYVAGVDEVGRGPLAGPVVAAAVILNPEKPIEGLKDSKLLTPKKREQLSIEIKEKALCYALGRTEHDEIDRINILQASLLAMQRAIENLTIKPERIWVDGRHCPKVDISVEAIIGGDKKVPAISAASIIAKVARDEEMVALEAIYPGYGFAVHKGYPTAQHLKALKNLGVTPIHRCSFSPVKKLLMAL